MQMPETRQLEYRYERKFRALASEYQHVEALIRHHPALLVEVYPPRYVNNLYLDTIRRTCYYDHVNGVPSRKKIRMRWYGNLCEGLPRIQLEAKIKQGWVGTKLTHPLGHLAPVELMNLGGLKRVLHSIKGVPWAAEAISSMQPWLLNRYHRRYFRSSDGKVRVTLENRMSFYHPSCTDRAPREHSQDPSVVVEIKFKPEAMNEATAVCSAFPLPLFKHSKYIHGIQLLYGPP